MFWGFFLGETNPQKIGAKNIKHGIETGELRRIMRLLLGKLFFLRWFTVILDKIVVTLPFLA